MEAALAAIYYVYYGADLGAGELVEGKKELDKMWTDKLTELNEKNDGVGDLITDIFDIIFNDYNKVPEEGGNPVLDQDGVASNGLLSFFSAIANFFAEIKAFFAELFSFFG